MLQETQEYATTINICYGRQTAALQARVPSGLTWAVAKAVTETLRPVMQQCILNQSRGYWLLSDALYAAFHISIHLQNEYDRRLLAVPTLRCGQMDSELQLLYGRMAFESIEVIKPCLAFAVDFTREKAHNMLSLMLDPRYKGLQVIIDYVGREKAMHIVAEYDQLVLMPLLVKVSRLLNPSLENNLVPTLEATTDSLFGHTSSTEEASEGMLKSELILFRKLFVPAEKDIAPLAWWRDNAPRFPHVSFLARQILAIPGSQIETQRIFSVAGLLCALRRCRLGIQNLDALVMILKNWPIDARDECNSFAKSDLGEFFVDEAELVDAHEDELQVAGCFEEDPTCSDDELDEYN